MTDDVTAPEPPSHVVVERSWPGRVDRVARRFGWQLVATATTLVIVFSAVRGVARGYEPVGDNALIALRARDVLTGDHPWIGAWSSASLGAGIDVNHPGPLLYDLLALPVRLLGVSAGVALAVAALHLAVVWTVGHVTFRTGGPTAALAACSFTALLVWTLGSELLFDPWQPNVSVLPFWLFVCALWAVTAGRVEFLALAAGAGSFVMQAHLSYVAIVPAAVAVAVGVTVFDARRRQRMSALRRPFLASLLVIGVAWAQPLWEQLAGPGRGNIGRMLTVATGGGDDPDVVRLDTVAPGLATSTRVLGSVWSVPPFWGRGGYSDTVVGGWVPTDDGRRLVTPQLASLGWSIAGLIVFVAALVAVVVSGRRLGERRVLAGACVAASLIIVAAGTVVVTPIDDLGLSPHKVRWLWVIGAFATWLVVYAALALASARLRAIGLGVLVAIAFASLTATLPTHRQEAGPVSQDEVFEMVADLRSELGRRLDADPVDSVVFDPSNLAFAEPYSAPVMAELIEHGVDLAVVEDSLARQLGPGRDTDPAEPGFGDRRVVTVRTGPDAVAVAPGEERLAFLERDGVAVAVFLTGDGAAT